MADLSTPPMPIEDEGLPSLADMSLMKPSQDDAAVSETDFANEVREDRLNLLWRITLGFSLFLLWVAFMRRETNGDTLALIGAFSVVGSFLTGQFLRRVNFSVAVWVFGLSLTAAITVPMFTGNADAIHIIPFVYPFIIFLMGLMVSPFGTIVMFVITLHLSVFVPFLALGDWSFMGVYLWSALGIMFTSTLLAAQVTGELYQIANWALENYSRQRRTAIDLFDNRQELERALLRSQVLGEKLQDINEELESAKHFRGQFLANMSHELRTPLNAIIGFSETMLSFPMMYDDVELPESYRRDLMQIHESGQQLLTVINDILDLSKVDAGKLEIHLERVQLDPLIDSVLMTAGGLIAQKPIELKRDASLRLPDVYADESRLRQVLLNLYSNAAKFTDKGSITLHVTDAENDMVRFSVIDTGEGIKADAVEKIFEEFTQTDTRGRDPRAGAGLGLTISRRLVNLMHGRIWAESVYGEGSTFHVVVPKYDPKVHGGSEDDPQPQRALLR